MMASMIDIDEAWAIVRRQVRPVDVVELPLAEALHRTLAAPVSCDVDFPPFDRSTMDGYAVRVCDTDAAPVVLAVAGRIAAGHEPPRALESGEAMQINTGAPMPPGADAVVRVEDTEPRDDGRQVLIKTAVAPGKSVSHKGGFAVAGQRVLSPAALLGPLEIGVAATCGASRVTVYRKPRVAVLVTGDELVAIDAVPAGAQIRDSNRWVLEALLRQEHVEPVIVGTAIDDREALRTAIQGAAGCDVLCMTGGVSMGAYDFVPEVLESAGAAFHVRKLAIKPGRPVIVATLPGGQLVFALPGNPVSAYVGFELLVRPALAAMQGRPDEAPRMVAARLRGRIEASGQRRSFRPARVYVDEDGRYDAVPLAWQGSGDPFGMAGADALITHPPGAPAAKDGEEVRVILLRRL